MSLPGRTASRYLLSAARVVLTSEQFTNGYLPDFRGNKIGRVPIPPEAVKTLRGCRTCLCVSLMNRRSLYRGCSYAFWIQRGRHGECMGGDSNQPGSEGDRCTQEHSTEEPYPIIRSSVQFNISITRECGHS